MWKIFSKFFLRLDFKLTSWEQRIVLFVGFLVDSKLQSSTVRSYISALQSVLIEDEHKLQEDLFLISSLTRACKLKNDTLTMRLPIHKQLLWVIVNESNSYLLDRQQNYMMQLYAAIFMAAYFGMLRIGEVTQGPHVLLPQNVHRGENKNKILFILQSSKTHCKGDAPQTIKISGISKKGATTKNLSDFPQQFCPFMILKKYVEIHPHAVSQTEQFFVFSDNSPVKPDNVRNHLHMEI